MLSKSCVYALRALVYVGQNSSADHKIGIRKIAGELDIPVFFLSKILQSLVKHKIIQSTKGPNGGFYLNEKSLKTKLITIVDLIDGLSFFKKCGLGLNECSSKHPCPLHSDFIVYREGIFKLFSSETVHDLIKKLDGGKTFIKNKSKAKKQKQFI